jgi:hypothetical protein
MARAQHDVGIVFRDVEELHGIPERVAPHSDRPKDRIGKGNGHSGVIRTHSMPLARRLPLDLVEGPQHARRIAFQGFGPSVETFTLRKRGFLDWRSTFAISLRAERGLCSMPVSFESVDRLGILPPHEIDVSNWRSCQFRVREGVTITADPDPTFWALCLMMSVICVEDY